jgi:hypothetical protein
LRLSKAKNFTFERTHPKTKYAFCGNKGSDQKLKRLPVESDSIDSRLASLNTSNLSVFADEAWEIAQIAVDHAVAIQSVSLQPSTSLVV